MQVLNLIQFILLQQAAAPKKGSGLSSLIFILLLVFIFYFFMIRPQSKQNKEQQKFRESLKKGDKIVTIGGIHGKISEVHETTVDVEVENGVKITFEKSAISQGAVSANNAEKK
ncbi:MAG: preprotein translocase subunit YajC [Bacteroidales bacterium]|nr:preprotein translocase subunit YajC [Bacteroidales bacterium]